jgi:hypothetical protein
MNGDLTFRRFSPMDIPDDVWDANAAQWRAVQGRYDAVAPGQPQIGPGFAADLIGQDPAAALRQAQMSHADWQALRAQQIAARDQDGGDVISTDDGRGALVGGGGSDQMTAAAAIPLRARAQPIDPQRTDVFQRGPDGKLHPIPGWHTTGPFDFGTWAHNINWGGVGRDLGDIAAGAAGGMSLGPVKTLKDWLALGSAGYGAGALAADAFHKAHQTQQEQGSDQRR